MTTYYVGKGGNNSNDGTTWALRKLTLNGAEDIPVAASDTVIVGPGTYREQLTCDVAGTSDSQITYEGDVTGYRTDGIGGIVRITGSDNDTTNTRDYCVYAGNRSYRTFKGFKFDMAATRLVFANGDAFGWIIEDCIFTDSQSTVTYLTLDDGDALSDNTVRRSLFHLGITGTNQYPIYLANTVSVGGGNHLIENCIFMQGGSNIYLNRVAGCVVKNCTSMASDDAFMVVSNCSTDDVCSCYNSIICASSTGFNSTSTEMILEDYNSIFGCKTARTNTNVGANSDTYPPMFMPQFLLQGYSLNHNSLPHLSSDSQLRYIAHTTDVTAPTVDFFGITRPTADSKKSRGAIQYVPMKRETTIMHTTDGDASLKMEDAGAVQFRFPVASTDSITASVWCYYSSDYAGTLPTMTIKQPGQSDIVVSDTDAAAVTWFELSQAFNPAALPKWLTVELRSDNAAATTDSVATYWDDLTIT